MANKSVCTCTFRDKEVLQQLGNLHVHSDDSGKEFTENEVESEVKINELYLNNASSSSRILATCRTNWIE